MSDGPIVNTKRSRSDKKMLRIWGINSLSNYSVFEGTQAFLIQIYIFYIIHFFLMWDFAVKLLRVEWRVGRRLTLSCTPITRLSNTFAIIRLFGPIYNSARIADHRILNFHEIRFLLSVRPFKTEFWENHECFGYIKSISLFKLFFTCIWLPISSTFLARPSNLNWLVRLCSLNWSWWVLKTNYIQRVQKFLPVHL